MTDVSVSNVRLGPMADESEPSSREWLTNKPSSRLTVQGPDLLVLDYPVNSLAARWVWDFCGTRCCSVVLSGGL